MKAFIIKGKFLMGDRWQEFTKQVAGSDEAAAREEIYSRFGSKHRVKRTKIHISEVKDIPRSEVSDPVILYMLDNKKKGKKTPQEPKKKGKKKLVKKKKADSKKGTKGE